MLQTDADSEGDDGANDLTRYQGNPNPRADKFKCGQPSAGRKEGPNEALAKEFDRLYAIYNATPGKNEFSILQYSRGKHLRRLQLTDSCGGHPP